MDNSELSFQADTLTVQGNPPLGTFKEPPLRTLTITDGTRKAVIDLTGPAVTYSGDLPLDESAKIFCDAVFRELRR
jgi:hypothetical protein